MQTWGLGLYPLAVSTPVCCLFSTLRTNLYKIHALSGIEEWEVDPRWADVMLSHSTGQYLPVDLRGPQSRAQRQQCNDLHFPCPRTGEGHTEDILRIFALGLGHE